MPCKREGALLPPASREGADSVCERQGRGSARLRGRGRNVDQREWRDLCCPFERGRFELEKPDTATCLRGSCRPHFQSAGALGLSRFASSLRWSSRHTSGLLGGCRTEARAERAGGRDGGQEGHLRVSHGTRLRDSLVYLIWMGEDSGSRVAARGPHFGSKRERPWARREDQV